MCSTCLMILKYDLFDKVAWMLRATLFLCTIFCLLFLRYRALGWTVLIAVAGNINSANCVFCFLSDFRSMRTAALF